MSTGGRLGILNVQFNHYAGILGAVLRRLCRNHMFCLKRLILKCIESERRRPRRLFKPFGNSRIVY